jgi:hypothetical protein
MAFALTVIELVSSLESSGCAICNQKMSGTQRALAAYLNERYMDRPARQNLMESFGFCPTHLFQMTTLEMRDSGDPIGAVIAYEQLSGVTHQELEKWRVKEIASPFSTRFFRRLWRSISRQVIEVLKPGQPCPICLAIEEHVDRTLAALMEELARKTEDISRLYLAGDGLCLPHLRQALMRFSRAFPFAADLLVQDEIGRLEKQKSQMGEYIRKHNWSYRDEAVSVEEERAWRKTLSFFSGYPPDSFQPFVWPLEGE